MKKWESVGETIKQNIFEVKAYIYIYIEREREKERIIYLEGDLDGLILFHIPITSICNGNNRRQALQYYIEWDISSL